MTKTQVIKHRCELICAVLAQAAFLAGCYQSWDDHGDVHDAATDADADATLDSAEALDMFDVPVDHSDVHVDTADVPPDSTITCPPPAPDGTWMSFTTSGTTPSSYSEMPCRVESVGTGTDGAWTLVLWCGTGARMETENITVTANPLITPMIFEGDEVHYRFMRETDWYRNEWFAVYTPADHLLVAGVAATQIAPWGWDVGNWYNPLAVYVNDGVCPAEETDCGTRERLAIEVVSGGISVRVFDGYTATVGGTDITYVHVSTAYSYLDMECDDVPDSYFDVLFVSMMP